MTGSRAESAAPRPTRPSSQPSQASQRSGADTSTKDTAPSAAGSGHSPDMSGDDSATELSPQDHGSPSESVKSSGPGPTKSESDAPSGGQSAAGDAPSMPLQKRRRVTRACDECRRKKIKCDGKQPCTHCSVYSYECTYDKPSNRRRNPAPQYIEALEARLQRAETLLRKFMPDVDLTDPSLDPAVQQEFHKREQARAQTARLEKEAPKTPDSQDAIMSMIESIGQLDINEGGEFDFHGISSGAVFLRRMKEHFQGLLASDYRTPFISQSPQLAGMFSLDSPKMGTIGPFDSASAPNIYDLPDKEHARSLCYYALNCATCLLRVVHLPSFYEMFDKIYDTPHGSWGNDEHRFLGLLYSVLALGSMYNTDEGPSKPLVTHKRAVEKGLKYYGAARLILQDVAECRDMTSLQALVYMILFLQATSNISGCYAFLGIALRSSLRMGLHRHLPHAKISPIEDESRRRLFHVIRQLDTYVSAILGFPILLQDEDVDQPTPTEVDDEYITKDAILAPPPGTPSFFQAFSAHSKLMVILRNVVKHIYPLRGVEECVVNGERPNATYMISYARIKEIERELHDWYEELPIHWRPSADGPIEVVRVRTLLRFVYAHVQLLLYRPFLHYVSPRLTAGKKIDDRFYSCAAAGISVSRNIVHIGIEIQKQSVLIGPYWFILYTEFFAILTLVFYVLENPDKTGTTEIMADARSGRDVIGTLAQRSLAADRITTALKPLFEQLYERLKKGGGRPATTKKRSASAAGSKAGAMPLPTRPGLQDSLPQRRSEELNRASSGTVRREMSGTPLSSSFDSVGMQPNSLPSQGFAGNLREIMPLDVAMASRSPDNSGASAGMHRSPQSYHPGVMPGGPTNPLYKLDAVMFSSGDPFAYPNQPVMDAPGYPQGRAGPHAAGGPPQDAQFYMPNVYDGIEGQLLGPIPPYLVPQGHGHHALDPASQMYHAPNMVTMHQDHGPAAHQERQRHQHQHPGQQRRDAQQMTQQQQQQDMMEDVMVDPNFQGDWDEILGNTGYR